MSVINGVTVLESPGWRPQKTDVLAAEMVNGYGSPIGDYVWTQHILSYSWPSLPTDLYSSLLAATDRGDYPTFTVTYPIPPSDGTNSGTFRVSSPLIAGTLAYDSAGDLVWGNVALTLEELNIP